MVDGLDVGAFTLHILFTPIHTLMTCKHQILGANHSDMFTHAALGIEPPTICFVDNLLSLKSA